MIRRLSPGPTGAFPASDAPLPRRSPLSARGLTILELVLAVVILAVGIIPIYRFMTRESATALSTEKLQMADKILASIQQELAGTPFRTLTAGLPANGPRRLPLSDGHIPLTREKVVAFQQRYKDFGVEGEIEFREQDTVAQVSVRVFWTIPGKTMERRGSFTLLAKR